MARSRAQGEAGMVTAELAAALTGLVLVLVFGLSALLAGVDLIRCTDAARVAARATVRGDDPAAVQEVAARSAPSGAQVVISGTDEVEVEVRVRVRGPIGALVRFELTGRAVGVRERVFAPDPAG